MLLKISFVNMSIWRNGLKLFLGEQSLSNIISKISLSSKYLFTHSDLNSTWFKMERKKNRFNIEDKSVFFLNRVCILNMNFIITV